MRIAYRNAEQIARAIGAQVLRVADVPPARLHGFDLLIVGSPTYGGFPTEAIYRRLNTPLNLNSGPSERNLTKQMTHK